MKLNHVVALQDWSPMYQINEPKEKFQKFNEIFENILSCHVPLKLIESSTINQQKQWLTKELRGLINENTVSLMRGRKTQNQRLIIFTDL